MKTNQEPDFKIRLYAALEAIDPEITMISSIRDAIFHSDTEEEAYYALSRIQYHVGRASYAALKLISDKRSDTDG